MNTKPLVALSLAALAAVAVWSRRNTSSVRAAPAGAESFRVSSGSQREEHDGLTL